MALQAVTTSDRLFERERELEAIHGALAQAAQGAGTLVVIDGPAGVGKTALLDAARDAAATDADLLVLRARGAELERAFGFGVVRQLFDEVAARRRWSTRRRCSPGAARFAAPLLARRAGRRARRCRPDDPFAARHALYWLTANLAAQRPLAMLVDDAHWADSASLRRARPHRQPARGHRPSRSSWRAAARRRCRRSTTCAARPRRTGRVLHVPPLGAEAAAAVVRSFAPSADDALCRECSRRDRRQPVPARELARSMRDGERQRRSPSRAPSA